MQQRNGATYRIGTEIGFGPEGPGVGMLGAGWSSPDAAGFVWSNGPEAELRFAIAVPARDVVCKLDVLPYTVAGQVEHQTVEVFFNYFRVGFAELKPGRQSISIALPRELFTLRTANLTLHIPGARSPVSLGLSEDQRRLGLALWSLHIAPAA
jgi:hypothetical protein